MTLTYPEFDARGDRNLPSLFLESFALPVRRVAGGASVPRRRCRRRRAAGRDPDTRAAGTIVRERTARHFADGARDLPAVPVSVFRRPVAAAAGLRRGGRRSGCDFLTQGGIVHVVLATLVERCGSDIEALFRRGVRASRATQKHIPISYQTERARNAMLDDLRKFAATIGIAGRAREYESRTELDFEFPLNDSVTIRGQDRPAGCGGATAAPW